MLSLIKNFYRKEVTVLNREKDDFFEIIAIITPRLKYIHSISNKIDRKLKKRKIEDIHRIQILILIDEILSNAILATIEKSDNLEPVILRFHYDSQIIDLKVFDFGKGIDLNFLKTVLPMGDTPGEFFESLENYRKTMFKRKDQTKNFHQKFGKGLRIISKISDSLDVLFHTFDGNIILKPDTRTAGSIVHSTYNYHKQLI